MKRQMQAFLYGAFAALALYGANRAHAEVLPDTVGVHIGSKHAESGRQAPGSLGWNNNNPGLYFMWRSGLTAGFYRNSLYRDSRYVGWTLSSGAFAVTVGAASGYDKLTDGVGDHSDWRCEEVCRRVQLKSIIVPLVVPSVRLAVTDKTSIRLSALLPPGQPAAFHLSVEGRF